MGDIGHHYGKTFAHNLVEDTMSGANRQPLLALGMFGWHLPIGENGVGIRSNFWEQVKRDPTYPLREGLDTSEYSMPDLHRRSQDGLQSLRDAVMEEHGRPEEWEKDEFSGLHGRRAPEHGIYRVPHPTHGAYPYYPMLDLGALANLRGEFLDGKEVHPPVLDLTEEGGRVAATPFNYDELIEQLARIEFPAMTSDKKVSSLFAEDKPLDLENPDHFKQAVNIKGRYPYQSVLEASPVRAKSGASSFFNFVAPYKGNMKRHEEQVGEDYLSSWSDMAKQWDDLPVVKGVDNHELFRQRQEALRSQGAKDTDMHFKVGPAPDELMNAWLDTLTHDYEANPDHSNSHLLIEAKDRQIDLLKKYYQNYPQADNMEAMGEKKHLKSHHRRLFQESHDYMDTHDATVAMAPLIAALVKSEMGDAPPKTPNHGYVDTAMLYHASEQAARVMSPDARERLLHKYGEGLTREQRENILGLKTRPRPRLMKDPPAAHAEDFQQWVKEQTGKLTHNEKPRLIDVMANLNTLRPSSLFSIEHDQTPDAIAAILKQSENAGIDYADNRLLSRYFPMTHAKMLPSGTLSALPKGPQHTIDVPNNPTAIAKGGPKMVPRNVWEILHPPGKGNAGWERKHKTITPMQHGEYAQGIPLLPSGGNVTGPDGRAMTLEQEMQHLLGGYNDALQFLEGTGYSTTRLHGMTGGIERKAELKGKPKSIFNRFKKLSKSLFTPLMEGEHASKIHTRYEPHEIGGLSLNRGFLPANATSHAKKRMFGGLTRPSWSMSFDPFSGVPIVHKRDNQEWQRLLMNTDVFREINPDIQPFDWNAQGISGDYLIHTAGEAMDPDPIEGHPSWNAVGQYQKVTGNTEDLSTFLDKSIDRLVDVDLLLKREDGEPPPIKSMHRIFDLDDLSYLRGFIGDWVVSAWPDGKRVLVKRDGDNIVANDAQGHGVGMGNDIMRAIRKSNEHDFIIDAIWDDKRLHVVDILDYNGKDMSVIHMKDRTRTLRAEFESTDDVLYPAPVNTRRTDDEGLEHAVGELMNEEGVNQIMLRDAESTYMKGESRHPKWVLYNPGHMVDVMILARRGRKPRYEYQLGIGPLPTLCGEKLGDRGVEHDGEHYMDVGTLTNHKVGYSVGEHITVKVSSVSHVKRDGEDIYTLHPLSCEGESEAQATDSVDTLEILANRTDEPVPHKVSVDMKKSRIIIALPSIEDEVIYKAEERATGWEISSPEALHEGMRGGDYALRLANSQQPYWGPVAAILLKVKYNPRREADGKDYREREEKDKDEEEDEDDKEKAYVHDEPVANHKKKPKKVDEDQFFKKPETLKAITRALSTIDSMVKEKITWTGPKGAGFDYASGDILSPRGPTKLTNPSTQPDFNPEDREENETPVAVKPNKERKTHKLRSESGDRVTLETSEDGVTATLDTPPV